MLGAGSTRRVLWYKALAAGIAMLTPIVLTTASPDVLPMLMQRYVRPTGDLTTFTMMPWSGFVLARLADLGPSGGGPVPSRSNGTTIAGLQAATRDDSIVFAQCAADEAAGYDAFSGIDILLMTSQASGAPTSI
jgi:hypothetical protein